MRINKTLAVLRALVDAKEPLSRREIRIAAGLPDDSEVTRPIRDFRKEPYGLSIERTDTYTDEGVRIARYKIAAHSFGRALACLREKSA
jgi:hypothetical protein